MFISGGARSGKSRFAEHIAVSTFKKTQRANKHARLYYIATSKRSDTEMEERIRIHQEERVKEWETIEESYDFSSFLKNCNKEDVILIDCLTIWLSNVMFDLEYSTKTLEDAVNSWLTIAQEKRFHLIFVSNDVNEGFPHSSEGVLTYMYALQSIHKTIVEDAEHAIQVIAGLPTYWKGEEQ
ncbi:bifunctional adenosylcobinamide kinase/adenosylcobinamide-phosphate guanylyltransferase [Halalkalibacter lacteus]|uniref:bifunctional adenosylcobinamide kinase/adenosylcobinamide-phosphate guanylyltransferase n=1 Tax=Halalkalibacter lacteus TaxID=3090663 RepID=UPI002FCAEA5C